MAIGTVLMVVGKTALRWGGYGFLAGVAFETGTNAYDVVSGFTEKRRADREKKPTNPEPLSCPMPRAA
jgi:hypothetical protein